jgi:hypothetical protein
MNRLAECQKDPVYHHKFARADPHHPQWLVCTVGQLRQGPLAPRPPSGELANADKPALPGSIRRPSPAGVVRCLSPGRGPDRRRRSQAFGAEVTEVKAVVYEEPFKVAVKDVEDPRIQHPNDVLVRVTSSAICGSDLHMYEGRTAAESGIVFGHENLGIVEETGEGVTSLSKGDRVVMPFNVACGFCKNCLAEYTGFCLTVNPGFAGGAYGYVAMGPYTGGQAERLRVPFADFNCLKLPPGEQFETDFVLWPCTGPARWV